MGKSSGIEASADRPRPSLSLAELLRPRSLLWLIPERVARRLGWVVAALGGIVPTVILLLLVLTRSVEDREETLAAHLSDGLGAPVRLHISGQDAPGHYRLSGISISGDGWGDDVTLRAAKGSCRVAAADAPGRLDLEDGTLRMNLEAWTRGPGGAAVAVLHNARANKDLRSVSLSDFTVELRLGDQSLSLKRCVGRVELTPEGKIEGRLVGSPVGGRRATLVFELGDDVKRVTLSARPLPWTAALLTPTLGEAACGLLDAPRGKLILANELGAGSPGDHWMLEVDSVLDLGRVPEDLGLGTMTGRLDVTLKAWGGLGRPGKLTARLRLPEHTSGTISAAALRSLRMLLSGTWTELPEKPDTHTFHALELSFILTPNFVCLTRNEGDPPTGIFGTGDRDLLDTSVGEVIPIDVFLERLHGLGRLWKEEHSG